MKYMLLELRITLALIVLILA